MKLFPLAAVGGLFVCGGVGLLWATRDTTPMAQTGPQAFAVARPAAPVPAPVPTPVPKPVPSTAEPPASPTIRTCFVPGPRDCARLVVDEIGKARRTIDFQAYNFTEPHIADALVAAHGRGVAVRAVLDKTAPRERGGKVARLTSAGIPVLIDRQPRIAHNKVIVIDGTEVIGGSFNYTTSADHKNAENVTVIDDPATVAAFARNFESRVAASQPFVP